MANMKYMNERKNELITRAESILNGAENEKRELTDDEAAELAEIRDDVKKIKEALKINDEISADDKQPKKEAQPAGGNGGDASGDGGDAKATEARELRAFEAYVRGDKLMQERAGELTLTDNGAVIPTTIANQIIKKVYDVSPVLAKAQRYSVKGKLQLPYYDTSENSIKVAYQSEFAPLASSNGKFTNIELSGYLAGALSKISNSLINNAQFDIVSFIVNQMGEDIARFIEHELLVGTTSKVEGLSTLKTTYTTAAATAITADDVIRLKDTVKDVYQNNAFFIMSPATRTALRLLKGTDGHYLLQDDLTSPFGSVLLGKPVYVSDNMPDIKAGATAIYYGDFSGLAVKFSEDISTQILREKFADEHATGVVAWFEFDSKVQDAQRLAKLVMASA